MPQVRCIALVCSTLIPMRRLLALWLLVVILALGVGVRAWQITDRSLWFDEAFSWRLIQFPLPEMLARDAADVHPPLYYVVLKGWAVVFGSSLLSLRLFSVSQAGLTILLGYLFTATAFRSRGVGLLAALALAISGFQIQFAWEARMYTLGTTFCLLSSWLLLKALRATPQRVGWWLAYGVGVAAFAYVHYYAFFSIAAQALYVMGYIIAQTRGRIGEMLQWRLTWYALLSAIVAGVLYSPWIPTFLRQQSQVQASFWIPRLGGWSVPDTFYRMYLPTVSIPQHTGVWWIILALVPLVLTVLAGIVLVATDRSTLRRSLDASWLIVVSAFVPFVLSIGQSLLSAQSLYQDRYFVFAHVFLVIMVVVLLARLPWTVLRTGSLLLLMVGFALAYGRYWQELDVAHKPGARAASAVVFTQRQPQEIVVVSSPFVFFAVDHYGAENYEAAGATKLYSETGEVVHFAGGPILTSNDMVGPAIWEDPALTSTWVVDTTGFGATALVPPVSWQAQEKQTFPEVHGYQGDVSATRYQRQ